MSTTLHAPPRVPERRAPEQRPVPQRRPPSTRAVRPVPRAARLHLWTYVVGNAAFWALWGATAISTGAWYWWPVVPFVGWTAILAVHLVRARR